MKSLLDVVLGAFKVLMCDDLKLTRDYVTLEQRSRSEGISFLTKTLPKLGKVFDQALGDERFSCSSFPAFRPGNGSATPIFMGSLFSSVFNCDGSLRLDASADAVRKIRQVCYLAYKLDLPYKDEDSRKVIDSFLENEQDLAALDFPSMLQDPILGPKLRLMSLITEDVFGKMSYDDIKPRHGPGVTSDVHSSLKYEYPIAPNSPSTVFFARQHWFNARDGFDRLERYPTMSHRDYYEGNRLCSKVILVPKDSRGPRLISCEPCQNMYIQQGLMSKMVDQLEFGHDLTRGAIFFRSNTTHRDLARLASDTQEWSTLDLKDASDRVHLDLVKVVFSRTSFIHAMLASRTDQTDLFGFRVHLKKWAPMGNALCFPVLAYVCFLLIYVGLVFDGVSPDDARSSIKVFGDDIIVKTEYAQRAMLFLEAYGLKVNRDKSFVNSQFAESCGFDAFRGENVTPYRLKKLCTYGEEEKNLIPASSTFHLVALAHYMKGEYPCLKEYFYSLAERVVGPLPYGLDLSYLCRLTDPQSLRLLNSWFYSVKGIPRTSRLSVWSVLTRKTKVRETPYGFLTRSLKVVGIDGVSLKKDELTLPRDSYLAKRRVRLPYPLV